MPDSFFASKTRKRKRTDPGPSSANYKGKKVGKKPTSTLAPKRRKDEELDSDETPEDIDDLDLRADEDEEPVLSDPEDANETPAEKRLRLAKVYLEGLREELGEGDYDAADIDRDIISQRLQRDVLDEQGKVYLNVADSYDFTPTYKIRLRGHRFSVTSAVVSSSADILFTAGKEGSIIKWNLQNGSILSTFHKQRVKAHPGKGKKKQKQQPRSWETTDEVEGHTDEVWCLALSHDGRYLASGGKDRRLGIWDVKSGKWVRCFRGHKDTISSLAFRRNTLQLFSASYDRSVKLFDLSVMGYVESLFGHQDCISSISALRRESAVTCGTRDKSVRFWKVVEESQLIFRGGTKSRLREVLEGGLGGDGEEEKDGGEETERRFVEGSIDCVAMIDETTFVSGGDSGTIALWITQKKKPVFTVPVAHGLHKQHSETEGVVATPRWITALACLPYSDLLASGSWEGIIRLWKVTSDPRNRRIDALASVPAMGFVNSLQLSSVTSSSDFLRQAKWTQASAGQIQMEAETHDSSGDVRSEKDGKEGKTETPILLSAGVGQEPRTGRWMKLKDDGVVNAALVYVFRRMSG